MPTLRSDSTRPESQTRRRPSRRSFSVSATRTRYADCRAPRPGAVDSQVSLGCSTSVPSSVSAYSTVVRSMRRPPSREASALAPGVAEAVWAPPDPSATVAPAPATELRRKTRRFQSLAMCRPSMVKSTVELMVKRAGEA
ncbi:hypothetical protein ABT086_30620 [Streptomyces mirabilis]